MFSRGNKFDIHCTRAQTDCNIPEGGCWSIPITLTSPGVILLADPGCFFQNKTLCSLENKTDASYRPQQCNGWGRFVNVVISASKNKLITIVDHFMPLWRFNVMYLVFLFQLKLNTTHWHRHMKLNKPMQLKFQGRLSLRNNAWHWS